MTKTKLTEEILKDYCKTNFAKGGGSCFECCDYEGMDMELQDFIKQAISRTAESLKEAIKVEERKHKVFKCNGTKKYEDWCEDENCPSIDAKEIKSFNSVLRAVNEKLINWDV